MPTHDLVARDTLGKFKATLVDQDSGSAIDLSSGSAALYIIFRNGELSRKRAMTLDDASNGVVSYTFVEDDLVDPDAAPGSTYDVTLDVTGTNSSGSVVSVSDPAIVRVRKPIVRGSEALS